MPTLRYPQAIWEPGPLDKQGYPGLAVNACRGVILHSMVGRYADAFSRLESADRASWHFSIKQSGVVVQHYDVNAVCWHAGVKTVNGIFIGIEHEGGPKGNESEPLTDPQLAASIALVRWLAAECRFPLDQRLGWGLHEHNEYYATACPSGRIPFDRYTEEHMPTPEYDALFQRDEDIKAVLKQVNERCLAALTALAALARHVYGDSDPQTLDIEQRLKALEE